MAAALALVASLLWGVADFGGGHLSGTRDATAVLLRTQSWALVALLVALAVHGGMPVGGYLLWGTACGVIGPVALACYYQALAIGPMGLVSPLTATAGVVPVLVGIAEGEAIGPARAVGIVLALLGGFAVATVGGAAPAADPGAEPTEEMSALARPAGRGPGRRGVVLALVAGLGFGLFYPLIAAGSHHSTLGTLVGQRAVGTGLLAAVVLARRRTVTASPAEQCSQPTPHTGPQWASRPLLTLTFLAVGLADLGANLAFALSSHTAALAVVGTLGSLYPVVTAGLAAGLLRERLTPAQLAGAAVALTGVVLLSS